MFGGGRGPMGGGGGMLRAAGRAMTRAGGVANGGIQDPFSSSPAVNASVSHGGRAQKLGSSSSSSSGSNNLTISATPLNLPVPPTFGWNVYEDFEWVSEDGYEEEDDSVFGSVPSLGEVQDAVSALQQVFDGSSYTQLVRDQYKSYPETGGGNQSPVIATGMIHHQVPSFGSDLDWMEPSVPLCHSRVLQPHAYDQVYNAFDLLRTEPSVQRMVVSLSSDKAVWDAVMNNEVVREIKDLYNNGVSEDENSNETPAENNAAMDFIKWVFENTMVKATEVFEKITKVVAELFDSRNSDASVNKKGKDGKFNEWLEEKLRTSVLLSIVVLLVVMVSRTCNRS